MNACTDDKAFFVYIMANPWTHILYTGVTSELVQRVYEHKQREKDGFTKKYNCTALVYFEECDGPKAAIEREKQIKGWRREKKIALIEARNPGFEDLSVGWYESKLPDSSR
jgi:putative endonuclease